MTILEVEHVPQRSSLRQWYGVTLERSDVRIIRSDHRMNDAVRVNELFPSVLTSAFDDADSASLSFPVRGETVQLSKAAHTRQQSRCPETSSQTILGPTCVATG